MVAPPNAMVANWMLKQASDESPVPTPLAIPASHVPLLRFQPPGTTCYSFLSSALLITLVDPDEILDLCRLCQQMTGKFRISSCLICDAVSLCFCFKYLWILSLVFVWFQVCCWWNGIFGCRFGACYVNFGAFHMCSAQHWFEYRDRWGKFRAARPPDTYNLSCVCVRARSILT
jgi:hypothetical protein